MVTYLSMSNPAYLNRYRVVKGSQDHIVTQCAVQQVVGIQ